MPVKTRRMMQIECRTMTSKLHFSVLMATSAIGLATSTSAGDVFGIPGGPQAVCTGLTLELTGASTCGVFQDPRFDYVMLRVRSVPALPTHTSVSISVWGPWCVAPILDARYIVDGGPIPSEIRVDHSLSADCDADPASRFWFAQFSFDPPLSLGVSSAALVLTIPKNAFQGWGQVLAVANDDSPNPQTRFTTCNISRSYDGCPSDFNCDNEMNLFDYLDFVEAFTATTDRADFNRDGTPDLFDYLDFVEALSSGC